WSRFGGRPVGWRSDGQVRDPCRGRPRPVYPRQAGGRAVPAARIGSAPPPRKRNISVTSRSGARSRASCPAPGSSVTVAAGSAAASSRVIWLAHGGLAVARGKSKNGVPGLAGGAGQGGGGGGPGFARQRRSDDGEHV